MSNRSRWEAANPIYSFYVPRKHFLQRIHAALKRNQGKLSRGKAVEMSCIRKDAGEDSFIRINEKTHRLGIERWR